MVSTVALGFVILAAFVPRVPEFSKIFRVSYESFGALEANINLALCCLIQWLLWHMHLLSICLSRN